MKYIVVAFCFFLMGIAAYVFFEKYYLNEVPEKITQLSEGQKKQPPPLKISTALSFEKQTVINKGAGILSPDAMPENQQAETSLDDGIVDPLDDGDVLEILVDDVFNVTSESGAIIMADVEWQHKYDKAVYDPAYDETWENDLFNEAYALAANEKYSGIVDVIDFSCEDKQCKSSIQLPSNNESDLKLFELFMTDLNTHPAILNSGKTRAAGIGSISFNDNGAVMNIIIE